MPQVNTSYEVIIVLIFKPNVWVVQVVKLVVFISVYTKNPIFSESLFDRIIIVAVPLDCIDFFMQDIMCQLSR